MELDFEENNKQMSEHKPGTGELTGRRSRHG